MKLEGIEPTVFFKVGIICFAVIAVFNSANLFYQWEAHNFFSRVSTLAGITFNVAMSLFFLYLYNQQRVDFKEEFASDDIDDLIKKIKEDKKDEAKK